MRVAILVFCTVLIQASFAQDSLPACILNKANWEAEVGNDWPYPQDTVKLIDLEGGKEHKMIKWELLMLFYENGNLKSLEVGFSNKKKVYFLEHLNDDSYRVGRKRKSNGKILRAFTSSLANPGRQFIKYWNIVATELNKYCWPYGHGEP
jgi:hypothetical protein